MEIRHNRPTRIGASWSSSPNAAAIALVSILVVVVGSIVFAIVTGDNELVGKAMGSKNNNHSGAGSDAGTKGLISSITGLKIPIFYPKYHPQDNGDGDFGVLSMILKLARDLHNEPIVTEMIALDVEQPPSFLKTCGGGGNKNGDAVERLTVLKNSQQPHLAFELLKYCALEHYKGGLYVDSHSVLTSTVDQILANAIIPPETGSSSYPSSSISNLAVLNDPQVAPKSIHGGLLFISKTAPQETTTEPRRNKGGVSGSTIGPAVVVNGMIQVLMTTNLKVLESSPLLLPKSLYDLIATDSNVAQLAPGGVGNNHVWYMLRHTCTLITTGQRQVTAPISSYALNSHRLTQNCPEPNGFCCSIYDSVSHSPAMMTKHLLLPYQILPSVRDLPPPLNAETAHFDEEDLPYIATITETIHQRPEKEPLTPNVFETLLQNDCLPSDKKCSDCLRNKQGANCQKCASACPCYCKALCHIPVEEKFISKSLTVKPPLYARDPSRLIPRIIHQTFFEAVTPEKYPNMSRLIESFKQSGWEYKFYTDDMSLNFLSTHFPPEVRQAYEALRPGAFKADLFRYCVLLIYGGVYADMDIMLEANLDLAVGPDVGFMVPQDEPGTPIHRRMCLWNGLIASAPGHPFLAKVIETVVNNVRNRFTSVDTDHLFCPDPELSILHAFDTLFTAGPCILGAMVNKVLGRNGQTPFEAGELDLWESSKQKALAKGTEFIIGVDDKPSKKIPGRTIILHQNKWDMGSHRFSNLEKNQIVAATDLPDSDDRANQAKPPEHYSKTHVKTGIYGLDRLYTDNVRANEELRIYVDAQWMRRETTGSTAQQ